LANLYIAEGQPVSKGDAGQTQRQKAIEAATNALYTQLKLKTRSGMAVIPKADGAQQQH
jgi:hypothetical protein